MSDSLFGFTSSFIVPTVVSIAIGSTPITSGSNGRLLFDDAGVVGETNGAFWDKANSRIGFGTTTPAKTLEVLTAGLVDSSIEGIRISVTHNSAQAQAALEFRHTNFDALCRISTSVGNGGANPSMSFYIRSVRAMNIFQTGNIGINTTTDAGFTTDINGTLRVVNDATFSRIATFNSSVITGGTTTFSVRSNSNTQISVQENNRLNLGAPGGAIIYNNVSFSLVSGSFYTFNYVPNNQLDTYAFLLSANYTNAGAGGPSEGSILRTAGSTATTTGIVTLNQIELKPTYNNTGGTTINRGLYYNPILTSITGTTNRAIETVTGDVLLGTTSGTLAVGTTTIVNMNYGEVPKTYLTGGTFINGTLQLPTTLRIIAAGGGIQFQQQSAPSPNSIITFGNDSNGVYYGNFGSLPLRFITSNATQMSIFSTGNVGINTTTDAGYKLDVNGTARVKTTDSSTPLNVLHSGSVGIQVEANANGYRLRLASSSTVASINTPDSYLSINSGGQLVVIGSTSTYNSAQVAVDSTTKGFLPPRMTTTQKNAIATPALGLVVFDTTLNKLCVFTTVWETVTSI
jgi:hypothetical protein